MVLRRSVVGRAVGRVVGRAVVGRAVGRAVVGRSMSVGRSVTGGLAVAPLPVAPLPGDLLPVDPPASGPLVADPLVADPLVADPLVADPLVADPLLVDRGAAMASAESVRWRPVPSRPAADVLGFPAAEAFRRPVPSGRGAAVGVVSGGGVAEVSTDVKRAEWHRGDEQGRSRRPVCASSATTRVRTPDEPGAATAVPGAAGRDDGLATGPVGRRERPTWRG
ncbi:hypothetical protein [Micromonospora sp. NPDC049204]|uniref:hypothetical protein n=1 Tax=Micromonospora sp. NPDC049204 TaxID=3154351 RepID=UPI0033E0BA03